MDKLVKTFVKDTSTGMEQFRARLYARMVIILIFIVQAGENIYYIVKEDDDEGLTVVFYYASIPFLVCLIIVIFIEFLLFGKLGSRMLKYTNFIDMILFIFFTLEWIIMINANLQRHNDVLSVQPEDVFEFTSFSWRCLLLDFIINRWQLKALAAISAYGVVVGFLIAAKASNLDYILIRGISHIIYFIIIYYFTHKMNFSLLISNIEQEKWLKINEFILDHVPENIAMLNMDGNCQYISTHLKNFIQRCGFNMDLNKFFREVKCLTQHIETDSCQFLPLVMSVRHKIFSDKSTSALKGGEESEYEGDHTKVDNIQDLIAYFRALIPTGTVKEKSFLIFNGKFEKKNSHKKSIEVKISFIIQDSKHYIFLILRDTTKRDHLVSLESTNKYKDRLLASVSHELRTPLNGNINLVEAALKSIDVPQKVKESLLIPALNSSKFLLNLTNDLLDMSQIKAQKLRLIFQHLNLKETLINTLKLLELHSTKKGIRLECILDTLLPTFYCTDHMRLGQIVLNLVNNSIKFTQKGFVRLTASLVKGSNLVCINIEDSGIGIEPEDIDKLFSDFTHIEHQERESLNPTGVGLGLNIAYNLSKILGPTRNTGISVKSVPGQGSIFSFVIEDKEIGVHLPSQENQQSKNNLNHESMDIGVEPSLDHRILSYFSPRTPKSLRKGQLSPIYTHCECPRVLIVDDGPFNILALENILSSLNIKSDAVYDGKSAINKVLTRIRYPCDRGCKCYALIFMDQEMPQMSGAETVQELRTYQKQGLIPELKIIGCTAHQDLEEVEKFSKSGIDDCIQKPISTEVVRDIVEKYLYCPPLNQKLEL